MHEYPWYFRSYFFVICMGLIIMLIWLLRKYSIKLSLKIITEEKYHAGLGSLLDTTPLFTGKKAVEAGRYLTILGDISFWIVLFIILIFTVRELNSLF